MHREDLRQVRMGVLLGVTIGATTPQGILVTTLGLRTSQAGLQIVWTEGGQRSFGGSRVVRGVGGAVEGCLGCGARVACLLVSYRPLATLDS